MAGTRLLAVLFLLYQFPEHMLGFGGGSIFAGFIISLNRLKNPLDGSAVSCVPTNFKLARQSV
jgi:hypothetical protein